MKKHTAPRGFTLIELLIVVLIIAILAAIAVPNFLEFQTRAKVARVKADLRSYAIALEAYCVDYNVYPLPLNRTLYIRWIYELSTPVAYMSSTLLEDPFGKEMDPNVQVPNGVQRRPSFTYFNYDDTPYSWWINDNDMYGKTAWSLASFGPDRVDNGWAWITVTKHHSNPTVATRLARIYDPTNGTVSSGDIGRFGGDIGGQLPPGLSESGG